MERKDLSPEEKSERNLRIAAEHHFSRDQQGIQSAASESKTSVYKKWGAIGLPLIFVLSKLKWVLALLKFTKLSTLLTMLLAVWAYAQLWGASFAAGFVLLIYVHEMGHVLMMRKLGIKAGAPVFIPFVGAVISMKDLPRNALTESIVAIGGPLLGTVGALFCLAVAEATGSELWYALASTGFLINLFNMLPVSPLDGGRITGVISRWFWLPGFLIGGFLFFVTQSPILFLVLLFGAISFFRSPAKQIDGYYDVTSNRRLTMATLYFGLLFFMAAGMWYADQPLKNLVG